uniref:Uncharacterized protein n=1 Tax=Anopheles albimanus TaxID=7167 RepID=A0A182FXT5_ANOAL
MKVGQRRDIVLGQKRDLIPEFSVWNGVLLSSNRCSSKPVHSI